ncbi:hypothetical protein F3Y22_tig00110893pilonHSYRG00037 [Hibiscus syriacus]|uniref:Reverse transcriptase zinc-binding domain-containing protein n=1 Tax=Hibiscus syriacus TaxID=106335 RepID=A0A6A2ZI01_HIBSY|nr:uncharacterized protein LOC120145336 [Hibiscus syriacus]KAE8690595.1 hypothetical protein F3Y22_tig00110893pilonHSYRG00037 [Hibiscus syriacus]
MEAGASHLFLGRVRDLSVRWYIWEELRSPAPKVAWHHMVWFSGRIPKHTIIVWMAILNRLPTRVRLLRMGLAIESDSCLFCGNKAETRDHLFFECHFAKDLWSSILDLCCIPRVACSWEGELAWASLLLKGNSLIVKILKLAWTGHVYSVWKERNSRLFGNRARSKEELLGDIKEAIQLLLGGKSFNTAGSSNIALSAKWGIA